jgi:hypothetical protein
MRHDVAMPPEDPPRSESDVLGSLPSRRPQRRSAKRDAPAASAARKPAPPARTKPRHSAATKARAKPRKPAATAAGRRPDAVRPSAATSNAASASRPAETPPGPPEGLDVIGTAVQAAGELVGLGVTLGTQAVRGALRRLPRP